MNAKYLCLIFGITPSVCGRVIWFMLEQVVRLLQDHPFACVKFSDEEKMRQFTDVAELQEPAISDIIGFMDSDLFAVKCTFQHIKQNAFYLGFVI
jgi:hypothetical protein